nr:hypothetical protein [Tanacetum cinerariifolium]
MVFGDDNWSWRLAPWGRAVSELGTLISLIGKYALDKSRDDSWSWNRDVSRIFKVKTLATSVQNSPFLIAYWANTTSGIRPKDNVINIDLNKNHISLSFVDKQSVVYLSSNKLVFSEKVHGVSLEMLDLVVSVQSTLSSLRTTMLGFKGLDGVTTAQ